MRLSALKKSTGGLHTVTAAGSPPARCPASPSPSHCPFHSHQSRAQNTKGPQKIKAAENTRPLSFFKINGNYLEQLPERGTGGNAHFLALARTRCPAAPWRPRRGNQDTRLQGQRPARRLRQGHGDSRPARLLSAAPLTTPSVLPSKGPGRGPLKEVGVAHPKTKNKAGLRRQMKPVTSGNDDQPALRLNGSLWVEQH